MAESPASNDAVSRTYVSPVKEISYVLHKGKGKGYRIAPHRHHYSVEIIYVDYGSIVLFLEGRELVLTAGDCVFIPPETPHGFQGEAGRPFDFLNILYQGDMPTNLNEEPVRLSAREKRIMDEMKREAVAELEFHDKILIVKLSELIFLVSRQGREAREALPGDNVMNSQSAAIARATRYLRDHLDRPLDAVEVARHARVSASYLRALFRKETGMGLREHLLSTRIETAKRLLRHSPEQISTIANRMGYQSVSRFCELFRRETGMTPRQYARSLGDPGAKDK